MTKLCSFPQIFKANTSYHVVLNGRTVIEVEAEVNLRPIVSRPVCPGVRCPSGTRDQFFFLLEIAYRQLRIIYFVAPPLTRGRVCNFLTRGRVCNLLVQLLLGLARAVTLVSKSHRTHGHILLSHLRLPQPGGPGSRIYIPQEQRDPVIPPGTRFPFCRLLRLAGTTVEVFELASTRARTVIVVQERRSKMISQSI
jgi:hypothetical protein